MLWLLSHAGPPVPKTVRKDGVEVVAIPGLYSVTYAIASDGAVALVDAGSRTDVPAILDALDAGGYSRNAVQCIVATHLHYDHILGLDALAVQVHAPIALGRVAHEHVSSGRPLTPPSALAMMRAWPAWIMQGMPGVPPADFLATADLGTPWGKLGFRSEMAPPLEHGAELPGLKGWQVLETPGHTDDSICLYHAEAGFLVAGDMVRNYVGGEWNPIVTSASDYGRSRKLVEGLRVAAIFPGHGPILEGRNVVRDLKTLPPWMP